MVIKNAYRIGAMKIAPLKQENLDAYHDEVNGII
jgi:hypothetical protein